MRTLALSCLYALAIVSFDHSLLAQSFSTLYNFGTQPNDPQFPIYSGIIAQGRDGNLYSTSPQGGTNGLGTVFKITPAGNLSLLHSFTSAEGSPNSGLTLGTDGNFYGTTLNGGTATLGTIFRITPSGVYTVMHNFASGEGAFPYDPPIQGPDLAFYGTTSGGGGGSGTVYRLTAQGQFNTIYDFDFLHGYQPLSPLVLGNDGNFYGTAHGGGAVSDFEGVVFKLTRGGQISVLENFSTSIGSQPDSGLTLANDGNFYGTTSQGGSTNGGTVFRVTSAGKFTTLHNINGLSDGAQPFAGVVQANDGNFYGVNSGGGSIGRGTLFEMTPAGAYSVLHNFDISAGSQAEVTLTQHTNGIFYGDTSQGGPLCGGACGIFYSLSTGLPPFTAMLPQLSAGKVGATIQFLGQGFTGTTAVSFAGTAAAFKVVSDTFLTATVPNGAVSGSVTITTPAAVLTTNRKFRVTPQILGFTPTSGSVGTPVTITGVSLSQTAKVTFGGVAAPSFTVNSDSQVTATVPVGAKTGKISITTPGGAAASAGTFTVN